MSNKQDKKNESKCKEIKNDLNEINTNIRVYEDKIKYKKIAIRDLEREKQETKAEMKNKMTKYGISKDLVVGSLISSPFASFLKSYSDESGVPTQKDIEDKMDDIKKIEGKIKDHEDEIFRIGSELRRLIDKRDDLVRAWRYSECGRS